MRYAAFIRAVNLGKNRRVTGAQLKTLFEEAGAEEVATFGPAGVVFEAPGTWRARWRSTSRRRSATRS